MSPDGSVLNGAATAPGWIAAASNHGWTYHDRIGAESAGSGLIAYYSRRYPHADADLWRRRLAAGQIQRNGRLQLQDLPLACGDRLSWQRPPWWEEAVPALGPALFDDGDLLVLAKPAGLPVLPAGGWLEHTVLRLLERRHGDDPAGLPRPVHRLGRFTSGLLVCARTAASRAWLSASLRESSRLPPSAGPPAAAKLYRALIPAGSLALAPGASLCVSVPIGRHPHPRLGTVWAAGGEGALAARSSLTLVERAAAGDLLEVAIATGRPHQIRIHCAAAGSPLLGDPLYGRGGLPRPDALPGDGGYQLHALALRLRHADGRPLYWQAPPPPLLARAGERSMPVAQARA